MNLMKYHYVCEYMRSLFLEALSYLFYVEYGIHSTESEIFSSTLCSKSRALDL
jgi:hypothetical protein